MRKEKLEELKEYINELKTIEVIKRDIENDKKFLQSKAYSFKVVRNLGESVASLWAQVARFS